MCQIDAESSFELKSQWMKKDGDFQQTKLETLKNFGANEYRRDANESEKLNITVLNSMEFLGLDTAIRCICIYPN